MCQLPTEVGGPSDGEPVLEGNGNGNKTIPAGGQRTTVTADFRSRGTQRAGGAGTRRAADSGQPPAPEVLVVPDYRDSNPYQERLAAALEAEGAAVRTRSSPGLLFPLSRLAQEVDPDAVHLHFFHPFMIVGDDRLRRWGLGTVLTFALGVMLLVDLALLKFRGVRTVWTVHDLLNHERLSVRTELFVKHVAVRLVFDGVILHCDRAGEELRAACRLPESAAAKFTVVPHGHFQGEYPDEVTPEAARDRLGLPADSTVFLFFGWVRPYKQVPRLIEHFCRLEDPSARLLVVGSAREDDIAGRVEELAGRDDRVRTVLEFVPDEEVQVYMAAADAVVLPFRTGERSMLTSGSVLLAMSFGRAVVAPDIGCIGAVLDERGGVPYEPAEDQPLRAMRELVDADTAGMGAHNRRVAESLDWGTVARRTLAVYRGELP